MAAVGRKIRPTHQVENSRTTLELAPLRLLWRHACEARGIRALYEQASGEKISDGLRVGIVLNRVTDTELATHLLLNAERFQTWALFRREHVDVSRARAAASGAYQMRRGSNDSNTAPMEIDALQQHGDKKCHPQKHQKNLEVLGRRKQKPQECQQSDFDFSFLTLFLFLMC